MGRYYGNTAGRFVSVDEGSAVPVFPQSLNRYTYVWNDPVNKIDPNGLFPCTVGAGEGTQVTECEILSIPIPPLWGTEYLQEAREARAERDFRKRLDKALKDASKKLGKVDKDCDELLSVIGVSAAEVAAKLASVDYQNGATSADNLWAAMGAGVQGTSETMTVADLFRMGAPPYPSAIRVDGLSAPNNTIYLRTSATNWENLVHEGVHQFGPFGFFSDANIMARLAGFYGTDTSKGGIDVRGATQQISDKIKEKCN